MGKPRKVPTPVKKGQNQTDKKVLMTKLPTQRQQARATLVGKKAGVATTRSSGLPHGSMTKGLRMPHNTGKDQIQKRLKNKSPWFQSIMDPLVGADVKIPDATGFETGTLQLVHRDSFVMPATVNGVMGFRVICPYPNKSPAPYSKNFEFTSGATVAAVAWDTVTVGEFETSAPLQSYSVGVRVVSACIIIQSEASLATNSGIVTGYINPFPSSPFGNADPLSVYQNHYKSAILPLNNNAPLIVRWLPIKENGGHYDMFYQPTNPQGNNDVDDVPFYEMGVLVSGAPSGATFLVTVVVNYEFLPFENAINILDATPSPQDAQEVDLVENWVQDLNVVTETTTRAVSKSPASSEVAEPGQGTGFGMFAEVVSEIAPMLLGLLL